jgi:hypothetical protein
MRRQNWWMRNAMWRQVTVAVFVLAAGLLQGIDRYEIWSKTKWLHKPGLLFGSIALTGVLVLANTIGDLIVQRRAHAGEGRRVDIHKAVMGALVTISKEIDIVITDLGANVFLVKRGLGYRNLRIGKWSLSVGRPPRLERIERIRLSEYPAMSAVPWTQSKGVIGDCWERARPEYVHWAPIAKKWSGKSISDEQWAKIKPEDKTGLSRQEFMEMVGKYAEIKAVPIKNKTGNVIGVVAVDRVWRSTGHQGKLLHTEAVEDTVVGAASVLQSVVGRS